MLENGTTGNQTEESLNNVQVEAPFSQKLAWNMRILEEITKLPVMIAIKLNYDYEHCK